MADVKGKLVLLDRNPAGVKWPLVKAGAIGAINAWGDDGWAYTKRSTPLHSFSITPTQAKLLRGLFAKGAVRVHASVTAKYYNPKKGS